jgi:hypothetical protein
MNQFHNQLLLCSFLAPTFPSHITQNHHTAAATKELTKPFRAESTNGASNVAIMPSTSHGHHPSVPNLKKMATEGDVEGKNRNSTERKSLNAIAAKCSISDQQSQLRSVVKSY